MAKSRRAKVTTSPQSNDAIAAYKSKFSHFALKTAHASGSPAAFLLAVATVIVWAFLGPVFHYSDTWQLVINTGTTIVTFLMVFLIQNTQNRDTLAIQLKLAELIISMRGAKNRIAVIEDMNDDDLERLHRHYCAQVRHMESTMKSRRR
ncbi:MAG: low affinity iron permease family protein [Pseudolabrys sp.]|nr:low affinity iron permease family protein [Pseudolabrys sp.]MBV9955248.1 low affinity iron permease family protein [Pseudolabrys sp.]